MSRVFTSHMITCKPSQYNGIMSRIKHNLEYVIPRNAIKRLSKIHLVESKNIINHAPISSRAKNALVTRMELVDEKHTTINVHSLSEVSGIFEKGVVPHTVFYNYFDVGGNPAILWMEEHGLNQNYSFNVGGPTSTIKKPGIKFMEKGFNKSSKEGPKLVTKYLKSQV